jgi:serine/threonine protein kinase
MALDPRRVKALFHAALDLPDPAGRPSFLDRECGYDLELRRRLEELLAAHDQPVSALERPLVGDPGETSARDEPRAAAGEGPAPAPGDTAGFRVNEPAPDSLMGSVIAGRYKLRQEIGEGGMGSVYLAEQTQPVKRHVALKLIKPGMDSRTVLARFESERQALALMDHPNIARVLDAGTTDGGRPFFVMELVKGIPLTDYCDQHRLGLPERLVLFRQICSAVQHAHQKGIIHRDLKPTNILVESHDGVPVPKVIDFGLAKATSGLQLSAHSLFTAFGTVAGTPLYMAPEQASFNALDIDTRADIYALGVILYELLTGSTPIQRETFKQAALDEILRVIREVEPPTPSSRISTTEALPAIATTRQTEPGRLGRFVRGDLDWIVMKALAKERQRRYESAIALAQDVERFTNHEPVSAGPPTAAYRLRKFVRRNRPQVLAAALLLLVLVAGIVGTTLGLLEARRQEREARRQEQIAVAESEAKEKARQAEALQRRNAEEQRRQAEKRLTQVEKANEILGSIFQDLNPNSTKNADKPLSALLGERLDQATAQIEGEAIGDPLAVARMQMILGTSQLGLGYAEKAIALFDKARTTRTARLGPDHPDTFSAMASLGLGYWTARNPDRAVPILEETLALQKAKLGPDHPKTLITMNTLAVSYQTTGKPDRALPLLEETLALRKAKLGPDHPSTAQSMNNLANGYQAVGKHDQALSLFEEALAVRKAKLGPDHPQTLITMNGLANSYLAAGKLDRAVALYEETLALRKAKLGPDHPDTLNAMNNLADSYGAARKFDRALPLCEEALALKKARLGPDHPDTLASVDSLASVYIGAGEYDRGLSLYEENLALSEAKLGPDHRSTLKYRDRLAYGYWSAGKFDQALPLYEETLALEKSRLGTKDNLTMRSMFCLASAYRDAGKLDQAVALLRELADLRKQNARADTPQYRVDLAELGQTLLQQKKCSEAASILQEALTLFETKAPDDWRTFSVKSLLGGALLGQGQYAAAEPLLRAGYEGMTLRDAKIPAQHRDRLAEALDRLIALAETTNRPDVAATWKQERAKLPAAPAPKPLGEYP